MQIEGLVKFFVHKILLKFHMKKALQSLAQTVEVNGD